VAVSTKTLRSALTAAGVAAVTGGILILSGVQQEVSAGVAGIAGIAAGVSKRRKSKMDREVSEKNEESTEGEVLYGLAVTEFEAGNYAKAVKLFSQALELNEESAEIYHLRGYSWGELGQWSEQIEDYSRAIEMGGIDDDLYFSRGVAYFNADLYENAISDFTNSLESRPENTTGALINRGSAFFCLHKYKEARMDFTSAIDLDADNSDAYFNRARAYQEEGDIQNAISDFDSAIRIDPQNIDYIIDRGIAWEQLGEKEKAIRDFANAISITPDSYRAHLLRGKTEREIGRLENAIRDFTKAIEIEPTAIEAIKERGFTNGKAGNSELAINDYTTAIDLEPQNAVLYYCRSLWKREVLDLEGALRDLNYSTELDPEYPNPYHERARIKIEEGEYQKALDEICRNEYYHNLIARVTKSLNEAENIGIRIEECSKDEDNTGQRVRFSEIMDEICSDLVLDRVVADLVFWHALNQNPSNKSVAVANLKVLAMTSSVDVAISRCIEFTRIMGIDAILNYLERLGGNQAAITYLEGLRQDNPEDAELCFRLGQMYLTAENDIKAIELMTESIGLGIEGELLQKAYATRCNAYLCLQRYHECIADIDNFFAMSSFEPSDSFAARLLNDRSTCKKKLGDFEGALQDAEQTIALERNEIYLNNLGNIQQDIGLLDEAICSFSEAYNIAPKTSFILTNRANAKSLSGDLEGALNDYTKAIEQGDLTAFYNRANLHLNQLKDYVAAIEDFTSAIDCDTCGDKHHCYYNRAYTKFLTGDLEGAIQDCDLALGIDSEYFRPIRLKAKTCYQLGDLYHARESYLRLVELGDANLIDYQELGSIENKLESFDSATRYLRHSNQVNMRQTGDPSDLEIYSKSSYYLAHSLWRLGNYQEAISVTEKCEQYCELNAEFLRLTACILDEMGNSEKAIETINRALALDDSIPEIWYDRGVIRRDSDDFEGAIADFKQAFALDSSFTSACHNIGSIYMHTGNMTQACHYWKMASDLGDQDSKRLVDEYCGEQ